MEYNIVTNQKIVNLFKESKYFKMSLGYASTKRDKSNELILNDKDDFAFFYNKRYNTTIIGQGLIGDISFYIDYYIHDDLIAFYYEKEEFIFELEMDIIKQRGIDFYLGHLIKKCSEQRTSKETEEKRKEEEQKISYAEKIFKNPGSVTYEDLQKYIQEKNANRL
ncbi:hypothetical protein EBU94_02100 [bacterium]|nr:hypothetical protein [bacterium]